MRQVTSLQETETNEKIIVSKNRKDDVAVMSMEEYKKRLFEEQIERKLLKAEKQIEQGKTVKASKVFKELEELYEFKKRNV